MPTALNKLALAPVTLVILQVPGAQLLPGVTSMPTLPNTCPLVHPVAGLDAGATRVIGLLDAMMLLTAPVLLVRHHTATMTGV